MATCLACTDGMSIEDILNKVAICDVDGNVSFRFKIVEDFATDCHSCAQFESLEDLLRKSLYCDDDGLWYIQAVAI